MRKLYWLSFAVLVVIFVLSPFVFARLCPIEFNQFLIQRIEIRYGIISFENRLDYWKSLYSLGINVIARQIHNTYISNPDFDDPTQVFEYIFSQIPYYAIDYPTEKFYYYSFPFKNHGEVSGNLRLADLERGEINLAYFEIDNPGKFNSKLMTAENGLAVKKIDSRKYSVTYKGKTVYFKFPNYAHETGTSFTLLPEERVMGRILDESATGLLLVYNSKTDSFYEVLDKDRGYSDTFTSLTDGFVLGERTGFLYYHDQLSDRMIIVGVKASNSYQNNYLDGPGDQVPIDINFKVELSRAYPSVLTGNGTDDYGVWLKKPQWQRFVLGPFQDYVKGPEEIIEGRKHCLAKNKNLGEASTCLTKEWWYTSDWYNNMIQKIKDEGKQDQLKKLGISY